jgi:hypothetical protein
MGALRTPAGNGRAILPRQHRTDSALCATQSGRSNQESNQSDARDWHTSVSVEARREQSRAASCDNVAQRGAAELALCNSNHPWKAVAKLGAKGVC